MKTWRLFRISYRFFFCANVCCDGISSDASINILILKLHTLNLFCVLLVLIKNHVDKKRLPPGGLGYFEFLLIESSSFYWVSGLKALGLLLWNLLTLNFNRVLSLIYGNKSSKCEFSHLKFNFISFINSTDIFNLLNK